MKLLVIDAIGLHTGFIGCYGNEWVVTPTLDSLAADGVVFDNHIADLPLLHNNRLSSARTGRWRGEGPLDMVNLFAERGWKTDVVTPESLEDFLPSVRAATRAWKRTKSALLWVDGPSLAPPWFLPQAALETYFEDGPEDDDDDEDEDEDDDEGVEEGRNKDQEEEQKPPLAPWPNPRPGKHEKLSDDDWDRLRDTYAGVVTYFDARVEELCNFLVERNLAEEFTLCITARSGLSLGEHGSIGDGAGRLHSERTHVPLILRLPIEDYAGNRIRALTQPVDLLPSFMEYCFNEGMPCDGHSFMGLLRREKEEIRSHAVSMTAEGREGYLRTKEAALCLSLNEAGETERDPQSLTSALYLKPEDRWEINDMSKARSEQLEEMEQTLRMWMRGHDAVTEKKEPLTTEAQRYREENV